LSSSLLAGTLHESSPALAGVVIFLVFSAGTVGQLLSRGWAFRTLVFTGLGCVVAGLTLITVGFVGSDLVEFFIGAVVGGAGAGVALVGGLAAVNQLAPPHRRAELLSSYNLMAYAGVVLPVMGFGLISEHAGATAAAVAFAALLFCVIVFAVIVTAVSGSALAERPDRRDKDKK